MSIFFETEIAGMVPFALCVCVVACSLYGWDAGDTSLSEEMGRVF